MPKGGGKPDWKNAKSRDLIQVWMVTSKIGYFDRHNSFKELGKFREASHRFGRRAINLLILVPVYFGAFG